MRTEFLLGFLLVTLLVLGCLEASDAPTIPAGVPITEQSYFVGNVWITERQVRVNAQYMTTVTFQGTATNYGPLLQGCRYEILAADVMNNIDGSLVFKDEHVVATQELGDMPRNRTALLNLSYTYPAVAQIRLRAQFWPQGP